jgi:hypothetical protein
MAKKKPQAAYLAAPEDEPNFDALDQFLGGLEASKPAQELPNRGGLRGMADVALAGGRGAVQGVRMFTDLAGSDNAASRGLRTVEDFIGGLRSAQAKQDDQEAAAILKAAENAGILDQVVAGAKAFAVAPVSTLAQAVGTSIPTIGAALIPGVGQGAAVARMGAALGMGAAQGAGSVKGQIYDEVKQELLQAGASPEEAERRALEASSYDQSGGKIATGAALGALAGSTGMERAIGAIAHGTAKQAPGMARRVLTHGATEALPEAAQGAQEKLASNQALYEQGFDVAPGAGVVAAGTMEGLAGFGMGAAAGLPRPAVRAGDQLRAEGLQPERGPYTRASNAAVEAAANKVDANPSLAAAADKIAAVGGVAPIDPTISPDEALMRMEAEASALDSRYGTPTRDDWSRLATAPQAEPEAPWMAEARAIAAADQAEIERERQQQEKAARLAQIEAAPVDRAPRVRTPEPAAPAPAVPADVVQAYVESRRNDGTPAGRFFATEFDAGRITRDEVQGLIDAARPIPKSPDQRLAEAAAQAPKPQAPQPGDILNGLGEPFRNQRAAEKVAQREGGSVIVVDGGWSVRPKESDTSHAQARTRKEEDSNLHRVGGDQESVPVAEQFSLPEVRGRRDNDLRGMEGGLQLVPGGGGGAAVAESHAGQEGQLQGLRAGQRALGDAEGATAKPDQQPAADPRRPDDADGAMGRGTGHQKDDAPRKTESRVANRQGADDGTEANGRDRGGRPSGVPRQANDDGASGEAQRRESRNDQMADQSRGQPGPSVHASELTTDIPTLKRQWQAAVQAGEGATARAINDRIVALKANAAVQPTTEAPASQAAAPGAVAAAPAANVPGAGGAAVEADGVTQSATAATDQAPVKQRKVDQVKAKRAAKAKPAPAAPESAASTTQGERNGDEAQAQAQEVLSNKPADVTTAGAPATHADPGEAAEPATPAVLKESLAKAAKREDRKPSEMRADLLAQIDAKLADAADEYLPTWRAPTKDQIRKAMVGTGITNEARIVQMLEGQHQNRVAEAADRIGYVMFDVPGDGKFKVLNTKSKLTDFRRQVESSPGFKNTSSAPKPEGSSGGEKGYGGAKAAIEGMIDEGDAQAAVDYAAMKGMDLAEVLKGQQERLKKVAGLTPTAEGEEAPAAEPAAPASAPAPAAATKRTGQYEASEVFAIYRAAESAARGLWSSSGAGKHNTKLRKGLRELGLKQTQVDNVMAEAATVHAQRTRGSTTMTYLSGQDFMAGARRAGVVAEQAAPAPAPAAPPAWHTKLPEQGEPVSNKDRTYPSNPASPIDGRRVVARLAGEAVDALTQTQLMAGVKMTPWVLPATDDRNGVVRLLPEDQQPSASWQQMGTDPLPVGMLSRDQMVGRLIERLRSAPLLASDDANAPAAPKQEAAAEPPAPQPEKQEAAPAENRLDNFGETLPPARRNMAAKLTEDLADDDIARRPLSEIWPLAENDAIEDTFAAAVAHAARAEIPSKPRQPYKLRLWVEKVKTLRGLAGRIVSGEVTRDRMGTLIDTQFRSLRDWWSKVQLLGDVSRDQWKRIGSVEERPDAIAYEDGKQVQAPTLRIEIDGKGKWLHGDVGVDGADRGTVGGNKAGIMAMLDAAEPEQRMKFEIRRNINTGEVFINKEGDAERRRLMTFASVEEARKAIAEQYDELVSQWEGVKARDNITERDLRGAENRPRAGKDHRKGRDVTPNEFQQTFGFRGGEFGKWVEQGKGDKERQALLNSAFDALMDLSDMLHIPPRAISLNGTLGIAFGSRGSGWASAHFEPSNLVINLTKTRGAGALAHEWFHALDNYFSRLRRDGEEAKFTGDKDKYRNDNYITHQPEALMVRKDRSRHYSPMTASALKARHAARQQKESRTGWPPADAYAPENWERDPSIKTDVRPEVEVRFADLVKALNDSPMTQRSRRLDKGARGYWGSTLERAARAFESFVQARMQEQGYHNDFLANVLPVEEMRRNPERYPYLLPGEVKPIADAFDALFSEVKTREDDAGNVAMFSRATATGPRVNLESARQLADQLASTGLLRLNVVQSTTDMPMRLQRQLSKSAPDGRVRGAYFRGTDEVWMVADHIRGANEFVEVALHEAFHRGLGKTIPDAKPLLREIWRTNQNVRKATADQMRQHGIGRDEAIEEALAKMAEAGEVRDLKGWPKLLEAIRTWLGKMARAVGIEMVWTDDMVADLVAASTREGLKAGVHADMAAQAVAADRGQRAQTETEAFKRWFGDSKVVDAKGQPLVVHHGTRADFSSFYVPHPEGKQRFYFAADPSVASEYTNDHTGQPGSGANMMPAFVALKNPAVVDGGGANFTGIDLSGVPDQLSASLPSEVVRRGYASLSTLASAAEAQGFDGVVARNVRDGAGPYGENTPTDVFVAFRPEQIKSAIGNRGDFDPTNPDIRAKRAPTVTVETDEATGAPVYATDDISIGFPQETERFEYVLQDGEKIVNYSIGPADGFDSYGFVELVIGADGIPKALADIEIRPDLRGQAIGEKVMAAILGAHPDADIEISNIVEGARGFWAKMGVPEQNRAAGEAYDGTLNYQTFQEAQDERAANRAAAGRGAAGEGRNAGTEDRAQGADWQAQGLMLSRAEPSNGIGVSRRNALIAIAASAAGGQAKADVTLGKAKAIAVEVLEQALPAPIASSLTGKRDSGVTEIQGAPSIKRAMQLVADTGPEQLRSLAKQIASMLPDKGVMLTIHGKGQWNAHGAVTWGAGGPHMQLMSGEGHTGLTYGTFIHEAMHLAVLARYQTLGVGVLRNNDKVLGMAAPVAAKELAQFKAVWEEFDKAAGSLSGLDEKTKVSVSEARRSPDEFFVRALTDARLQAVMAKMKYEGATLLERFKDWIKSALFGLRQEGTAASWLDAALEASNDLVKSMAKDEGDFSRMRKINEVNSQRSASDFADGRAVLSRAEPADAADMRAAPVVRQIQQRAHDLLATKRNFNWWHRTVGTQYHKAQVDADFGRVFNAAQDYLHDTSAFANEAADMAPDLLPQLKSLRDLKKTLGLSKPDREKMAAAVFQGTLDWTRDDSGQPVEAGPDDTAGIVWTPAELRERFGFTGNHLGDGKYDGQIGLYQQFRASVDRSLDTLVASDVVRLLGSELPPGMRALVSSGDLGRFKGLVTAYLKDAPGMGDLADQVNEKYARIEELKARGYAPLMRFGRYTVDVVGEDGERKFFGLYENEAEANRAARQFKEGADPGDEVTQGVLSEEAYKQFQGMTPETLELFAEVAGVEKNDVFQEYLKRAKNNRSALKRLIHRKGIAGYSEDASRVLAQFLTSNARAASSNLHLGEMAKAVQDIPKQKGDVIDEAIRLREYVQTPQEEAQALRGLMFASFLGGSVASAMVNLTQPLMMTLPYLSQFGGPAKAAARLMGAMGAALGNYDRDSALGKALAMAEKEGIVSPQEMHQLQAEASGSLAGHPALRRLTFAWGSLFSAAEQFNRRLSFVAAYNTAVAEGKADPAAFAAKAVEETQGVYNKGNKPRFARGTVGAVAFTFKQYSVSYMEFLKRLPTRERTMALAVLLLAAGAQGMPGADDLDDLIDTLGQGLGYDTNAKLWKTRVLSEAIGSDGADFVLRGFSALPGFPLDVAGRLGLGNMIPGTGLLLKSKQDKAGEVAEALGPAASLAKGVAGAVPALASGNLGGVVEGIAPKAVKDLRKALEMYQTGEYRDTKGRKVTDADATDALVKGLGFQPAQVARDSRRVQMANQQIALAKATEAEFADAIARARVDGDPDAELKARQRLADWNASNPESRIVITPAQLARRARELRTTRDDRFVRTAPKEMRQSIKELVQ